MAIKDNRKDSLQAKPLQDFKVIMYLRKDYLPHTRKHLLWSFRIANSRNFFHVSYQSGLKLPFISLTGEGNALKRRPRNLFVKNKTRREGCSYLG